MNDRMAELRGSLPSGGAELGSALPLPGAGDVEEGSARLVAEAATTPAMKAFYDEAEAVKRAMTSVKQNIAQIEKHHGECLTAISAEQGRASTEKLEIYPTCAALEKLSVPHSPYV